MNKPLFSADSLSCFWFILDDLSNSDAGFVHSGCKKALWNVNCILNTNAAIQPIKTQ